MIKECIAGLSIVITNSQTDAKTEVFVQLDEHGKGAICAMLDEEQFSLSRCAAPSEGFEYQMTVEPSGNGVVHIWIKRRENIAKSVPPLEMNVYGNVAENRELIIGVDDMLYFWQARTHDCKQGKQEVRGHNTHLSS